MFLGEAIEKANKIYLCGATIWSIPLWSAVSWPFPRLRRRIVTGQTGRLKVGLAMSALCQKRTFRGVFPSALTPVFTNLQKL